MRTAYTLLATCLPLALVGCGEAPTEAAKAAEAYNEFTAAIADKDYEKACERLTPKTRQDLVKAGQVQQTRDCSTTLEQVVADVGVKEDALTDIDPADVRIAGSTAVVDGVRMSKPGDEWLVEGDLDFVRPFLSGSGAEL